MNKYKAVYIEWVDSATTDPGWMSEEDALQWGNDEKNNIIKEIGFILKRTKNTIVLVSRIHDDNVAGVFKIPVKCITKLTSLSI